MSKVKRAVNNGMGHVKDLFSHKPTRSQQQTRQLKPEKTWLDLRYHEDDGAAIKKPDELENEMQDPPLEQIDGKIFDRIAGSMIGMALGDALGAHVEFRPRQYLVANPVVDLQGGGTWGLKKGQFTDDTSMALCLANSLVVQGKLNLYDQLVRYKWWYRNGYMSSTGECFDIGAATSQSLKEFEHRQDRCAKDLGYSPEQMDYLSDEYYLQKFNVYCSTDEVAGNGALMRLAPVPLFFYRFPTHAVEYSGRSGQITHGDTKAYDACRYYGALIVAALSDCTKEELLDRQFYVKHAKWFGGRPLCPEVQAISEGSYQRPGGYKDGIRGKGYIVSALEAALWAFWSDENSFERGALAAVNLGDDTDTTAAIYGQLAGAYYGYKRLPRQWVKHVYAKKFMLNLSGWVAYEGQMWQPSEDIHISPSNPLSFSQLPATDMPRDQPHSNTQPSQHEPAVDLVNSLLRSGKIKTERHQNGPKLRSAISDASGHTSGFSEQSTLTRGPLNCSGAHLNSIHPSQSNGMNANPFATNWGSNEPSLISSQHQENALSSNNRLKPLHRTTETKSSEEQPFASSTRSKTQGPPIPSGKKVSTTAKASAPIANTDRLSKNTSPTGYPSKNKSPSTTASKRDKAGSTYNGPNSTVPAAKAPYRLRVQSDRLGPSSNGFIGVTTTKEHGENANASTHPTRLLPITRVETVKPSSKPEKNTKNSVYKVDPFYS